MHTNTTFPIVSDTLHGVVGSHYVNVAEDGTLCFVSDKLPRSCSDCGTVFVGSACASALAGPARCPFCGEPATHPLTSGRLS